jgi:hypothetical protein
LLRLQQAWDEFNLPMRRRDRFGLQADELHVLGRKRVSVILPPAPLVGVFGESEQLRSAGLTYAVVVQKLLYFVEGEATASELVSADLGR